MRVRTLDQTLAATDVALSWMSSDLSRFTPATPRDLSYLSGSKRWSSTAVDLTGRPHSRRHRTARSDAAGSEKRSHVGLVECSGSASREVFVTTQGFGVLEVRDVI